MFWLRVSCEARRERGVPAEAKFTRIKKTKKMTTKQNSTIKGMLEENTGGGNVNLTSPVPSELCCKLGEFDGVFLLMAKRNKPVHCGKEGEQGMGGYRPEGSWVGQESQGRSVVETEGSGGRRGSHQQVGNCV